jgi:hypothetical protein
MTEAKKSPHTTDSPGGCQQRFVRRCRCRYQAERAWGYDLCEWIGGRKSWKNHGKATHPEDVVKYASDKGLKTILIRCNGCGADVLREYPANDADQATASGGR